MTVLVHFKRRCVCLKFYVEPENAYSISTCSAYFCNIYLFGCLANTAPLRWLYYAILPQNISYAEFTEL